MWYRGCLKAQCVDVERAIFWPSRFKASTPNELWKSMVDVWNDTGEAGVSAERIKEDILGWVKALDRIEEAFGAYVKHGNKKSRRGHRGDMESLANFNEKLKRRFLLDLATNPIEMLNGHEVE